MKYSESLTVISVEFYCKVNFVCFICLKMIKTLIRNLEKIISYINKLIEIVALLITF